MPRESSARFPDSVRPDTLVTRFIDRAASDPVRVAYHVYAMGASQPLTRLTWGEWLTQARSASGALLALHALQGSRVAIFSDNRALWPVAAMGVLMCGLVPVAIHPQCTSPELALQLVRSGATIVVVDTIARFKMLRSIQRTLPVPITIVCDDLEPLRTSVAEGVYEFESWCGSGARALDEYDPLRAALNARVESISSTDAAFATFDPEGALVLLSHDDIATTTAALANIFALSFRDRVSSYRPLAETSEFAMTIAATVAVGYTAALLEHASDAFGVARQFEASIFPGDARAFGRVMAAFGQARETGNYLRDAACEVLGRHCRLAVMFGGVLPRQLHDDMRSGGVALATVYGTTTHPTVCVNGIPRFDDGAIGYPLPDFEVRSGEHDELFFRRKQHSSASDPAHHFALHHSWIGTGDRVVPTDAGSFRIIGHRRDLLRLHDGRLLAPQPIEAQLQALPLVAHAVCHADGGHTIVAVLSLKRAEVEAWARRQGVVMPWEALIATPLVHEELARGVAQVNAHRAVADRIAAFAPTDLEFTVHTGELNHAGHVVRDVIASRFRHIFADLHQQARM